MPLAFSTGTSSHPKNTLQKRKLEIKVLVLLHVLIPGVMLSSSLKTINPWLSACDLIEPAPPDVRGVCTAAHLHPGTMSQRSGDDIASCPKPCPLNQSSSDSQCLAYLDETRKTAICNFSSTSGSEWLKNFLGQIRLRHCCEYKIIESLAGPLLDRVLAGKDDCFRIIDDLVEVDNLAARVTCEFTSILSRYDCRQPYSARFTCSDCQVAYRRWVCSTLVPYFNGTRRIRPCRSICHAVEQMCPYFLPENRAPSLPTQYAGEPTFLCMDPYIPETGKQKERSLYPPPDTCCVKPCGEPRKGNCLDEGTKCEDLEPYENATIVECSPPDPLLSWPPTEQHCPGPATHPSFIASAIPKASSRPYLIIASTVLSLEPSHDYVCLLVLFLLSAFDCRIVCLGLVQALGCLLLMSAAKSSRRRSLFDRVRRQVKSFFHIVKLSGLIFNYFKFNSNKWQYYFILISVNLYVGGRLSPAIPSASLKHGLKNCDETRGNDTRHSFQILSNSAQKLKTLRRRRMFCGFTRKRYSVSDKVLVIETTGTTQGCGVSLRDNSLTIDRLIIYSMMILKLLIIKILHCRLNYKGREQWNVCKKKHFTEMNNCGSYYYFNIRLLLLLLMFHANNPYIRTNVVGKSTCSSSPYKFVWYYYIRKCNVNEENGKKHLRRRIKTVSYKTKTINEIGGNTNKKKNNNKTKKLKNKPILM